MKVIHTIPTIAKEASGPSYSVTELCYSLINKNINPTLAALDWAPMLEKPKFLKTFPIGYGPKKLGRSPLLRRWLFEQAQDEQVDIIHNHSLWMMPNVYPGQIAKAFNIPYILSPRGVFTKYAMSIGSPIKKIFWPLVQRPSLDSIRVFHATAQSELIDIRRMGFKQPVAIIPNGIDIPNLPPKSENNGRRLLFLGRIHENKGLDMLIPAWKVIEQKHPDWTLYIVGPDENGYRTKMINLTSKLGLKRVVFSDAVYGDEKWSEYNKAELFILPSYSENFGMSVAEALAAGVPSIVTKGAPWSGLERLGAGWWIDISTDALVACLELALRQSPETLKLMGERGREWMKQEFSWEQIGHQMSETYRWMIGGGVSPSWVYFR